MNNSNNLGQVLVLSGIVVALIAIELQLDRISTALESIARHFSP